MSLPPQNRAALDRVQAEIALMIDVFCMSSNLEDLRHNETLVEQFFYDAPCGTSTRKLLGDGLQQISQRIFALELQREKIVAHLPPRGAWNNAIE